MSDFTTVLTEQTGGASDVGDISLRLARLYFYDFDGYPVRLWNGEGVLQTTTSVGDAVETAAGTIAANEWIGTVDERGNDLHQAPDLSDARDGASPRHEFGLPYIDKETFDALRADKALAQGRRITVYNAIAFEGEGMLPQTPIHFDARLTIRDVTFSQMMQGQPGNETFVYSAKVLARSSEGGRSLAPRGTMTDTSIRERSRQLGVAADSGGAFIAANSQRTYLVGG